MPSPRRRRWPPGDRSSPPSVGGMPGLLGGDAVLVAPGDVDALDAAVRATARRSAAARGPGRAGPAPVAELADRARHADQVAAVYAELLGLPALIATRREAARRCAGRPVRYRELPWIAEVRHVAYIGARRGGVPPAARHIDWRAAGASLVNSGRITKHLFVTGGVASSLGKGLTASQPRQPAQGARPAGHHAEARPVPQRRSRHDEPVPARRGLRHRRRRRDRPGHRPLRALPRHRPASARRTSRPARSTPR